MPLDSMYVFSILDRIEDANGDPVSGGTIYFYDAGTTTPKTVYSDSALSVSLGTSVATDSGGYPVSGGGSKVLIYVGTADYKVIVKDSAGNTLATHDNIKGAVTTPATTTTALPTMPMVSRTTTYSVVVGDQGKWINANPTSASFAITLPSAVTAGDAFAVGIRHVGTANVVTLRTTGSETITFAGQTKTAVSLTGKGQGVWLVSDGANWHVTLDNPAFMQANGIPYFAVTDRLATPPSSPIGGARYIISGTPTGAWATLGFADKQVAEADGNGSWFAYTSDDGWLAYVLDENLLTQYRDTAWTDLTNVTAPTATTLGAAVFEHQLANGTVGGTGTAAAWTTRTLNTSVSNTITSVALASNQITLPVGTYFVSFAQALYSTALGQGRIKVISGTATPDPLLGTQKADIGVDAVAVATTTEGGQAFGQGILTVTATAVIELQYWYTSTTGGTSTLGHPSTEPTGSVESYARVTILSLAAQQGPIGPQGTQGLDGLDAAHPYQWSTATSGDPGSGKLLGNSATIASITQINISETDSAGGSNAAVLDTWDDSTSTTAKGTIKITKEGAPQNFHVFRITAAQTDAGTYRTFPVSYVGTSGAIANGNDCAVLFVEKGDQGDPGLTVPTISGLTEMTVGQIDRTADYLVIRDTSAGTEKKILPSTFAYPLAIGNASGLLAGSLSMSATAMFTLADQTSLVGTMWLNEGSATISGTSTPGDLDGKYSVYLGLRNGTNVTTAKYNSYVGFETGERTTTGSYNTFIGEAAGTYLQTASNNTVGGWKAFLGLAPQAVTGAANNGSGLIRLAVVSTADWLTGDVAVVKNVGGVSAATGSWTITVISGTTVDLQGSTFSGTYTSGGECFVPITGGDNSVFGYGALWKNVTGASNVAVGLGSGAANRSGGFNVFVGRDSGLSNTSGSSSTYLGYEAGRLCTTGSNTYVGSGAGRGTVAYTGTANAAFGVSALNKVQGSNNTAFGVNAGLNNSSGGFNIFFGAQSGLGITTASSCMAVGYLALNSCNADNNLGIGLAAGYSITSGVQNLAIGYQCQTGITTGSYNVVIGSVSGLSSSLANNIVIGDGAGTIRVQIDANGDYQSISVLDSGLSIRDNGDRTKVAAFQISGLTTGTTRTITVPDADVTLLTPATQAQMEAGSATTAAVTPAQIKNAPGVAKAYVNWTAGGTTINSSTGVTSITRTGAGNYTVTFSTAFSSANFASFFSVLANDGTTWSVAVGVQTTTTAIVYIRAATTGTLTDPATSIMGVFFGDQ